MMNMKDVSSDVTPAKVSEVKSVEAPKEIGENKNSFSDAPKEIGETSAKVQEIPQEIGENDNLQPNTSESEFLMLLAKKFKAVLAVIGSTINIDFSKLFSTFPRTRISTI